MRDEPIAAGSQATPPGSLQQALFLASNLLFLVSRPSPTQDVFHRVVSFVACIFEKLIIVIPLQFNEDRPRPGPCLVVDDCCTIFEPVVTDASETFNYFQLIAVITRITGITSAVGANRVLIRKVRCLYNERVSFPVPARIAHEQLDLRKPAIRWINDERSLARRSSSFGPVR